MNILVDARPIIDPARGGVSRVALELCTAYADVFPSDTLICVTTGATIPSLPEPLAAQRNVRHIHLAWPNKLWSIAAFLGIVSLVGETKKRVDRIDAAFFPNLGFLGRIPRNIPTTLLLHDVSFLIEPSWFSVKQRLWHRAVRAKKLINSMTHLLAVSETTKRDTIRILGTPQEKINIIPLGPTLEFRDVRSTNGSGYVLALGSGDPRKNIRTAIEAIHALRMEKQFQNVELTVVGRPTRDARRAALSPWLHFIPRPTDEELAHLYANAEAFLYPSWYEGYGLPLHEAAQFGTPRIASTSGALPETAPPDTFFANPAKPQQWTEALCQVIGSKRIKNEPSKDDWKRAAQKLKSALV